MSNFGVLQEGRPRRSIREAQARRARRRRRIRDAALMVVVGFIALLVFMASGVRDPVAPTKRTPTATAATPPPAQHHPGYTLIPTKRVLRVNFKEPPQAALLFDVRSGRILWARDATRRLAIASLTKIMTALVIVQHSGPGDRVLITRSATHFSGSGVGLLPLHKRVSELSLLYGLLLPSGNDAAIALAQRAAGTVSRFVGLMNARASAMRLECTHFTTPSGIQDRGNHSCASDLAALARAVLRRPRLARIVRTRAVVRRFPIKGHKLFLYNNNPLLGQGYRGTTGVKTGYTVAAGQCLVATARRGPVELGVVLLHSPNSGDQARRLLDRGFHAERVAG
jgi:serine-type D-Ala-D-Ala carboxypeptidase (penicillin-binding protein 5/6)